MSSRDNYAQSLSPWFNMEQKKQVDSDQRKLQDLYRAHQDFDYTNRFSRGGFLKDYGVDIESLPPEIRNQYLQDQKQKMLGDSLYRINDSDPRFKKMYDEIQYNSYSSPWNHL